MNLPMGPATRTFAKFADAELGHGSDDLLLCRIECRQADRYQKCANRQHGASPGSGPAHHCFQLG
jgi:hypothetical protein